MNSQNNRSIDTKSSEKVSEKVSEIVSSDNGFKITGALVYSSASSLLEKSMRLMKSQFKNEATSFNFDCSEVTRIDSAGIALLVEWKRTCDQNNKQFSLTNLPDQAKSLVETYRLEKLLQ
ncbi:hypothetical protein GCM10009133_07660 [Cocleimonas flava]|uniref:Phospholipid transport system transporter-binding protein n=1 Tax=Cocleimonas flava TaxID=634765 RepID=A0A4R1F1E2_9GAMM|nr:MULTISPECIES: STAS domain-containing protein [Cocleimonas]MEB8432011.1 STAS domain-containing protein [Cocleimonas sp. KMM 6892]MEC4714903.1 STAS domain-containing protein [Cocleimonas sp. KMM 6895]MEC4744283.1 STAS domain-containing protein [Cocleimonas sp. KMM 6896]TCJ87130.1 phospholipid transport system transporter-binding protein [Cocleimonas flava]